MHPLKVSVKEKGGKPDRKSYPIPYGLRNPYRNLKSENSQDYAQEPQWIRLQFKFCAVLARLYLSASNIKFPNVIDQISTFNSNPAERALLVYT